MPASPRQNLELKARCADLALAERRVAELGALPAGIELQADTYFVVPHGRLKLRRIDGQPPVLIGYNRPDCEAVRQSDYFLVPVADADLLETALASALGVRGVVRKRRQIYLWHNVRIHLDEVDGLGTFIEFEAVLTSSAERESSIALLEALAAHLHIQPAEHIAGSYANLLGFA